MDSLTHLALGAAIGTAVLGRRAGPRAALWGALCSTLPDLDVLVPWADPVSALTNHRAWSHSLLVLSIVAPAIAWLIAGLERRRGLSWRDWLALGWLALVSHPLLDAFTVYGTQMLLPFSDRRVALGSVFIVDPIYTAPLVVGTAAALALRARRPGAASRLNVAGLAASTLYLAWTVIAQAHVTAIVERSLAQSSGPHGSVLVTASPLGSVLWRVVVMDRGGYREGLYSLLDRGGTIAFEHHPSSNHLLAGLRDEGDIGRLTRFTQGFYSVSVAPAGQRVARGPVGSARQLLGIVDTASAAPVAAGSRGEEIVVTDLRMGQTPWFVYSYIVAERDGQRARPVAVQQLPMASLPADAATRLWRRATGDVHALR